MVPNPYIRKFNNGFGTPVATYEASVTAICPAGAAIPIGCDGIASGHDSTPMMTAKASHNKRIVDGCCFMDFIFVGAGGFPNVSITFNAKKLKFSAKVGAFGWEYLNVSGTIHDCCKSVGSTTGVSVGSTTGVSVGSTTGVSVGSTTGVSVGSTTGVSMGSTEVSCENNFPTLPKCDEVDESYDLDSWEDLEDAVRKGEGLDERASLDSERAIQDDRGDYPGVGYHYNFYHRGKPVGGGFGVKCCRDTESGPDTSNWRYKYTG